jgi:CheY-like chemotaxis protein
LQAEAALQHVDKATVQRPSKGTKMSSTVLLAEDSAVPQDILRFLLTQRGHKVDVVDDGEQALTALQSHDYDIALLDFHLPKLDGVQVVTKFQSMPGERNKHTHFIGITADIEGLLAHPFSCEAFDLVIAKPIDVIHLCSVVDNFERYLAWTLRTAADRGAPQPNMIVPADNGALAGQAIPPGAAAELGDGRRRAEGAELGQGTTVVLLGSGEEFDCRVLDLSLSGAALEIDARPPIGERVRVGRTEGTVVRHTNEGIAVEFARAVR